MNLCKRACLYSVRKKGKTLTLLAFLLVMATLMLTCLSIQSATETANANIKKALLGYFTINAKTLENGIPEDTVSQILAMDGLSGRYTLRSYTYAISSALSDTGTLITTLIIVITAVSMVLIILILSMSIRSRKRETGILLAVGIAKPAVILQYVLETLLIAVVAFPLAYLSSKQVAGTLGTLFGKAAENVIVTPEHFMLVAIVGGILLVAAVLVSSISTMRLKPKQILAQME